MSSVLSAMWTEGSVRLRPVRSLLPLALLLSSACAPDRPDVLLVSIDTLRADHLPLYGYDRPTSPNLEAFAEEAVLFQRAYSHAPFTLVSHMSLFTSLFPAAHGVEEERALSGSIATLTETLERAGYETRGFYSISWVGPEFGFARGFDSYERKERGDTVLDAALDVLEGRDPQSAPPLFLFLHFRDVHCGPNLHRRGKPLYDSPREYRDRFLPRPELAIPYRPREIWEGDVVLTPEQLDQVVAQYDGGILYVDALLGKLFEYLKQGGQFEDALIILTSDHGESLGQRGTMDEHGGFWEEGLRVPLLVKLPSSHELSATMRGVEVRRAVQLVDIAPTVSRVAGLEEIAPSHGIDLFAHRQRSVVAYRKLHSVLIEEETKLKAFLGDPWSAMIYDLDRDPGEERPTPVRGDSHPMVRELARSLRDQRALFEEAEAGSHVQLSAESKRALEALGYVQ